MKKLSAVFLALLLTSFAAAIYADADAHSHCVCGVTDCTKNHEGEGIDDVVWQAWSGDTTIGKTEGSTVGSVYLYLVDNVTIAETLEITNVDVYLCLNGKALAIKAAGSPVVRVGGNRKFVLCDCKGTGKITGVTGSAKNNTANFGAVNCQAGGSFVMYSGSIADNEIGNANGGGVYVKGGTFTMYGGSVRKNKAPNGSGGAISVENGKIYTYGGEMSGNSAINGGAIHLKGSTEGEIRSIKANGNTAKNMGGAMYTEISKPMEFHDIEFGGNNAANGGGIYIRFDDSVYEIIHNAYIHDNSVTGSGGGIYLDGDGYGNPVTNMYDSNICDNTSDSDGGGIFATSAANVNLYGNSISGNICAGKGGGIRLESSTYLRAPVYEKTIYIKGNRANFGGGISTDANMLSITGNLEIEGNIAASEGGGVHITRSGSFLIFTNTTITKNSAPLGGGIYLNKGDTGGELEIGGETSIIGNTSSTDGSANNLYLNNGRMFWFRNDTLSGLSDNTRIGVSTSKTPTLEAPVNIEYGIGGNYHADGDHSNLIMPDNDSYIVIYKNNYHQLVPGYTVTLDPNNGEEVLKIVVKVGDKLSRDMLPELTQDDRYVEAWYANGAAYNFDKPVSGNFTLTARWVSYTDTTLIAYPDAIVVNNLKQPAVLLVASYNENGLLDIKRTELAGGEKGYVSANEIGLNTENATKIAAFLWDNSDGKGIIGMRPFCESAAAELYTAPSTE